MECGGKFGYIRHRVVDPILRIRVRIGQHGEANQFGAKVPRGPALQHVYGGLKAGFPDAAVDEQDGLRLGWRDRWLHVRPSNTEPIIRLIAEAPDARAAQQLVEEGRRLCAAS